METGWMSQFNIALGTKRRIIFHGNIMDSILDCCDKEHSLPMPFVDWLKERLSLAGYSRIITYNNDSMPRVIKWDDLPQQEAENAFFQFVRDLSVAPQLQDDYQPAMVLKKIRRLLSRSEKPAVAIITHADLRIRYPSQEAVALNRLTENAARISITYTQEGKSNINDETPVTEHENRIIQNLAILIYSRGNSIPPEFVSTDPDTSLILVPRPNYTQRLCFFERCSDQFYGGENIQNEPKKLAHITEGYRMNELDQLLRLSQLERISLEQFPRLQALYKFGRKEDRWAQIPLNEAEDFFLNSYCIRGQDEAVSSVIDMLYIGKHRIPCLIDKTSQKPRVVLFLVGPTGVGKTMVGRGTALFLTGSTENFLRIDMSEYRQDHSDQRLIGPPPGYVGYTEGGQLTNFVKAKPFSVVLMDEVEKANSKILDLLLQILDGARLTDGKGETVDFTETSLVFTSNIGMDEMNKIGDLDINDHDTVSHYFMKKVEEYFERIERPELFNRLKRGVVVFNFIQEETALTVLTDKLKSLTADINELLECKGSSARINFSNNDKNDRDVVNRLLKYVNNQKYGLRDVNNIIEQKISIAQAKFLDDPPDYGIYGYGWDHQKDRVKIYEG
ncbi:MAG: AAA family ATPase [bacterium]